MVNNIIDGISIKLNQVFGDGYEIYSEDVKQGLNEPCFFISLLNNSKAKKVGNRFYKEHFFDIHYFPSEGDKNKEMNDISEQLFDALEYITVSGNLIRGTSMNCEAVNDVLHFFVNYNMFLTKVEVQDMMEEFSIKSRI